MESTGKLQPLLPSPGLYFAPRLSPDGKRLALAVGAAGAGDIQVYDWQRDTMTRLTFTQTNQMENTSSLYLTPNPYGGFAPTGLENRNRCGKVRAN
jgi:Tol biopolymer transport system component